jgi:hypothetical protein
MPITRSRFLRPCKNFGLVSVAPAIPGHRSTGPNVVPRATPTGPPGQPGAGDRVASGPRRWIRDRPGCAPGQLQDRVPDAHVDHAAEDRDAGHDRVSRPAPGAPDDALARSPCATSGRLRRPPADARLGRCSGSAGGDRCSSRKRAVLPRKGAKRCWQPRAAVGSRKPDRSPDCRDLDELLRSTRRSGCRTSDRSRTSTPPWATRSPTELQRQARRAGAAAAGPDPHDDATRSRCPAPPQAVSPDPYFPDSERMSRTPRRAPAPPPPARRAARATRRRPRRGNRR